MNKLKMANMKVIAMSLFARASFVACDFECLRRQRKVILALQWYNDLKLIAFLLQNHSLA
jgi:hypothetical protein